MGGEWFVPYLANKSVSSRGDFLQHDISVVARRVERRSRPTDGAAVILRPFLLFTPFFIYYPFSRVFNRLITTFPLYFFKSHLILLILHLNRKNECNIKGLLRIRRVLSGWMRRRAIRFAREDESRRRAGAGSRRARSHLLDRARVDRSRISRYQLPGEKKAFSLLFSRLLTRLIVFVLDILIYDLNDLFLYICI